jgi:hypothetical protein
MTNRDTKVLIWSRKSITDKQYNDQHRHYSVNMKS